MDVALLELNGRSVRPDFELLQILGGGFLQGADPPPGNEEASIACSHDLNCVPLGDIAHRLGTKFRLDLGLANREGLCVLGISYLVFAHACNLTSAAVPS